MLRGGNKKNQRKDIDRQQQDRVEWKVSYRNERRCEGNPGKDQSAKRDKKSRQRKTSGANPFLRGRSQRTQPRHPYESGRKGKNRPHLDLAGEKESGRGWLRRRRLRWRRLRLRPLATSCKFATEIKYRKKAFSKENAFFFFTRRGMDG